MSKASIPRATTISVVEFVHAIFGGHGEGETIALVPVKGHGAPANDISLKRIEHIQQARYAVVSTVRPLVDQEPDQRYPGSKPYQTRKVDLVAAHCLVLDDIGTKVNAADIKVAPTWNMETSPGNHQYGYRIEPVYFAGANCPTMQHYEACVKGLIEAGLSDPGALGAYRKFRVTGSYHEKNAGFRSRVVAWHPERVWTLDGLMGGMGVEPWSPQKQQGERARLEASALPAPSQDPSLSAPGQLSVIDAYNAAYRIEELLASFGYRQQGNKWLHPASRSGEPGVVLLGGGYFSHHSRETDDLADGHTHDAFDIYTQFEHGGDRNAALKDAGEMLETTEGITVTRHNQREYMQEQERQAVEKIFTQQAAAIGGVQELDIASMIIQKPTPYEFLIHDPTTGQGHLTPGVGAGLAAPGGSGKSLVLLELCFAAAIGGKWLNHYDIRGPIHTHYFTLEDNALDIHHRIHKIAVNYFINNGTSSVREAEILELVGKYLHVRTLVGHPFKLTQVDRQSFSNGPAVEYVIDKVNEAAGSGESLVVIDPLRKTIAGKEDGEALNAAVTACDAVRVGTQGRCTTMIAHHASQASMQNHDLTEAAFRGGGDLKDGLRWTMVMAGIGDKDAKDFGLDDDERSKLRSYSFPKANNSPKLLKDFLRYCNGSFEREVLVSVKGASFEKKAENAMPVLCSVLGKLEGLGEPVSIRSLREHCKAKPEPGEDLIPIAKKDEAVRPLLLQAKKDGLVETYNTEFAGNRKPGEAWRLTEKGQESSRAGVG